MTDVILIRMLERMLAVVIGGIGIYFGYRLFALLPTQSDSNGKIELPGLSVVLAKVGPGIFFAAFGSLILYKSLQPISIGPHFVGAIPIDPLPQTSTLSAIKPAETPYSLQEKERVRQALQMLNCMEKIVTAPRIGIRPDDAEGPVRDAKLALLNTIWNQASWGKPDDFKDWASGKQGPISPELHYLYLGELPGCPK